ncbi:MAG TPA: hypothetical protein PKI32_03625 [Opitutales bacterium]|nr:hypothetical protein [Opitutales bacterium]
MKISKNNIKFNTSIGSGDSEIEVYSCINGITGTVTRDNAGWSFFEDRFSTEEIASALKGERNDSEEVLANPASISILG